MLLSKVSKKWILRFLNYTQKNKRFKVVNNKIKSEKLENSKIESYKSRNNKTKFKNLKEKNMQKIIFKI